MSRLITRVLCSAAVFVASVASVGCALAQFGGGFGGGDPFGDAEPATEAVPDEPAAPAAAAPLPSKKQPVVWADGQAAARQKIEAALSRPLTSAGLDFTEAPLEEVVEFLRNEYKLEIQLDEPALDQLGIGPDEPITCAIRNVTLRSALRRMLSGLELSAVIVDEVLLITTEEEADTILTVAAYPVGDLLGPAMSMDDLVDLIVSTAAVHTWAENGGGEAEVRPHGLSSLVVSQTHAAHREIRQVLTAMRAAQKMPEAVAPEDVKKSSDRREKTKHVQGF